MKKRTRSLIAYITYCAIWFQVVAGFHFPPAILEASRVYIAHPKEVRAL